MKNKNFVEEIPGPDVLEGNFDFEFVQKKNQEGYNAYWFPNHPSDLADGIKASGKHIDKFEYCFIDMDLKDGVYNSKKEFLDKIEEFDLQPSLVVDSGNGIHVYWKIGNLTRQSYVEAQFRLINYFQTDESIWTVLQLMRVPGTYNTKTHNEFKETIIHESMSSREIYGIDDLLEFLPDILPTQELKMERHIAKMDGTYENKFVKTVDPDKLPDKFKKILNDPTSKMSKLFKDPIETHGDRSGADMKLCNLLFNKDFTREEAFQVMLNTQKARERVDREDYAATMVEKVYTDRVQYTVPSVSNRIKSGFKKDDATRIYGPPYFDCMTKGWRRKQVLGIVGAEGIGKTSVTLDIFKFLAQQNPDDIYLFFSLEMTEGEIVEELTNRIAENEELHDRVYVVANEDDEGNPRHIGLQEIYWYVKDMEKSTGKKVAAIAIDHVSIIGRVINTQKQPDFNLQANAEVGWGEKRTMSLETICGWLKTLAKMLDTFIILQSQTTKEKGGQGDIPITGNAAYGISHFNWYCDYVMGIWQPIRRMYKETDLRVLAWQYSKIRGKRKDDLVQVYDYRLLAFDEYTYEYRSLTDQEEEEFGNCLMVANKIRKMEEKKQLGGHSYKNSLKRLETILKKIDGGTDG